MWNWIRQLDGLLRGELTSLPVLRARVLDVPVLGLAVTIDLLGMVYGLCMGVFAVTGSGSGRIMQIPASMIKVPLLFLLTLIVTLPSLYVFNTLVGSRLSFTATARLLISALAVMLAVLSSAGPIVAFFSVSTTSYDFMILLNVVAFAAAGFLGLGFMLQTLRRMSVANEMNDVADLAKEVEPKISGDSTPIDSAIPLNNPLEGISGPMASSGVRQVFRIWLVVFALVGAQMGWVLRPFIGAPGEPFSWLRPKQSNFFMAVGADLARLVDADSTRR